MSDKKADLEYDEAIIREAFTLCDSGILPTTIRRSGVTNLAFAIAEMIVRERILLPC